MIENPTDSRIVFHRFHITAHGIVGYDEQLGEAVDIIAWRIGFVDTEWQKTKPAEIRRNIENKVSLGRFCDPDELAEVYKMLIENSYFNGEIVVVDGGYSYK